ncbi:MAG TPA: SRPBCC family protein [Actinomycetota bacterium]|nr:SRPBCC family protein [Actinomycetota bacterium]
MAGLVERQSPVAVSIAECSVEVDATPEEVWTITSDPRNLAFWDPRIRRVHVARGELAPGASFEAEVGYRGVHTTIPCEVLEWEPPWRARVHLGGVLEATVTTSIAALPFDRSVLRHEVRYRFRGRLGGIVAAGVQAVGGADHALRRGTLAQKRAVERRAAR